MSMEQNFKEAIRSARELVAYFPEKPPTELIEMTAQEMLYPNRSNEKFVNEAMFNISNAIELVVAHPNSLDGVLARKLEEKTSAHHQELLANPQLLAELAVGAFAHQIGQWLDMGKYDINTWRGFGDKFIESPEFKEKISGKAAEEFGEVFMSVWGMEPQDGYAYFMENVTEEKTPALYGTMASLRDDSKPSAAIKV